LARRFDPAYSARLPIADNRDLRVILFCSEGYASTIAALSLQDPGLRHATDTIGGFHAWKGIGLPIIRPTKTL
jgi:rhodanese-related sulfurtransferase